MSNFVDIHQHLAYGVDDGAKSLEDMQKMILRAAEEGVTDIVCTTHATPGVEPFPMEKYQAHLEDGRAFIQAEGLGIRLHSGCEVLYTDASARLVREGQFPTLAGSDLVLVEFSPDASFRRLCDAASSFGMAGYGVLFAHVERYDALRSLKNLRKLRAEFGVYTQMNTNTVMTKKGFFTERWVRHALVEGLIDCVATDAHNLSSRPCKMSKCHEMLAEKYGVDFADELCGGFQRRMLEL